jgi:ABC-type Fe3+-hydroxamate transport system substrate-binding protein
MGFEQVIDQMGLAVKVPQNPQRIISLVPSQTELLFDLGLEDRVVGVTKFCVHPKDRIARFAKVGGTKKFDFEKIAALEPDLIIGNKEENYKEGIERLQVDYPVWMSDIFTLEDSLEMMHHVGMLTNTLTKADALIDEISKLFERRSDGLIGRALYFIWQKPYMVAGADTFISEMLPYAGFENLVKDTRYPELTDAQIRSFNPAYILLSSEPFPFREQHVDNFKELCPEAQVILVDGEMFSWYGSRLRYAPAYFSRF